MIVLAIDTCFARCAACLYDSASDSMLAQTDMAMERGHAETLAPLVAGLLQTAGLSASAIERIAVTTGPGTFTGLRIGLSFARAFGLALNIPVTGLDTLRSVALAAADIHAPTLVVHHAGRSGFFYALGPGRDGDIELLSHEETAARIVEGGMVVLGTGAAAFQQNAELRRPARDLPDLALLARYAAHQPASATMPEPVYIRAADAKPQAAAQVVIRAAMADDFVHLAQLHQASFSKGWTVDDITAMLETPGTQALLGESGGQISSLVIFRAIAGEAEILTLATAPAKRRLGHGAKLLGALIQLAELHNFTQIFLEVAADNEAARTLYGQFKFAEIGLRKRYYARPGGTPEDAVLMRRDVMP